MLSEEGIRPALVIGARMSRPRTLLLLAQQGPQPAAYETVHDREGHRVRVFEVSEPSPQQRVQFGDHLREALAPGASSAFAEVIEEPLPALLSHSPLSGLGTGLLSAPVGPQLPGPSVP